MYEYTNVQIHLTAMNIERSYPRRWATAQNFSTYFHTKWFYKILLLFFSHLSKSIIDAPTQPIAFTVHLN